MPYEIMLCLYYSPHFVHSKFLLLNWHQQASKCLIFLVSPRCRTRHIYELIKYNLFRMLTNTYIHMYIFTLQVYNSLCTKLLGEQ